MKLDKWYYTNQMKHEAKHAAQQIVRGIFDFPSDVFQRKSVVMEDVNMSKRDDLLLMIADDGFPEWAEYWGDNFILPDVAARWTKVSYLRQISEGTENVALLADNFYPVVPYNVLTEVLSFVPDNAYGLRLVHWYWDEWVKPGKVVESGPDGFSLFSGDLGYGFWFLFTPAGAGAFLDLWREMPEVKADKLLVSACKKDLDNFPLDKWYSCTPELIRHAFHIVNGKDAIRTSENRVHYREAWKEYY